MSVHPLRLHVPSVPKRVTGLAPQEHRIIVLPGGFKMHVLVINPGKADVVLFLHGVGASPDLLHHPLSCWAKAHDVTMCALYLPCHGLSDDIRSFPELIDVIGLAAEKLGLRSAVFMGHSLGAHLVVCLAESRPDLMASGVVLSLPTKIYTSGLHFLATMPALGIDAYVTSNVAMLGSFFHGNPMALASAFVDAGVRMANGYRIYDVLKGAPDLAGILPHVLQPMISLHGGFDLAVLPAKFASGGNFESNCPARDASQLPVVGLDHSGSLGCPRKGSAVSPRPAAG